MKKLYLFLLAAILSGAALQAQTMPKGLCVAGWSGNEVKVYNCNTKETKTVKGYFRNFGVDNSGNVYVLVCSSSTGWGNYYVYKNFNVSNPYMKFEENAGGIYSSMAMRVKGNDVVVAGVQSKGFNNRGYESRMFGYVNNKSVFLTGYDRKSLKRDNFRGYTKVAGSGAHKRLEGYGQENNSGNPQGDELSCVYHVDAVDYLGGKIYTTGWGEREYTETPAGYQKYYLVRRCPRVWRNGAEIVQQYENRTGAAWNINVLDAEKRGEDGYHIFTSGHQRSVACSWLGNFDHFNGSDNVIKTTIGYPGFVREEVLHVGSTIREDGVTREKVRSHVFCHLYICKTGGKSRLYGRFWQFQNTDIGYILTDADDVVAVKDGCYYLSRLSDRITVSWLKKPLLKQGTYQFTEKGVSCTVPEAFRGYKDLRLAVSE